MKYALILATLIFTISGNVMAQGKGVVGQRDNKQCCKDGKNICNTKAGAKEGSAAAPKIEPTGKDGAKK